MQMETSTKECGSTTKLMVMAHTSMQMEPRMWGIGSKTSSMGRVLRHGPMELAMKEAIKTARKMERVR